MGEYMEDLVLYGREVADMRRIEEKERRKAEEIRINKKQNREVRKKLKQSKIFG